MKGGPSMAIFRWLFAFILLVLALMYANSTISYLWATGVSKNAEHNYYLSLSNFHFVMTLIFIIAFIIMIIFNIKALKSAGREKPTETLKGSGLSFKQIKK